MRRRRLSPSLDTVRLMLMRDLVHYVLYVLASMTGNIACKGACVVEIARDDGSSPSHES